jgi:hypothetical protein
VRTKGEAIIYKALPDDYLCKGARCNLITTAVMSSIIGDSFCHLLRDSAENVWVCSISCENAAYYDGVEGIVHPVRYNHQLRMKLTNTMTKKTVPAAILLEASSGQLLTPAAAPRLLDAVTDELVIAV